MNNSELSIMASSEDAFIVPETVNYGTSWDTRSNAGSQTNALSRNESCDNRGTGLECVEEAASHRGRDTQAGAIRPSSEDRQHDLGFWLLHRSADRHDQWERLLRLSQGSVRARQCGLQYSSSVGKRTCDVVGSLFLLLLLLPLFIVVAILIKLDSPGPVFFRHYRIGKDGRRFVLWKFRSMKIDVPEYETSPRSAVDGRLTRIGRLIRRLSIDELPQLINVLKGDMSLVGPRPEMPFIVARYHSVHRERLVARPGITGLWQISPARAFPIHENLQYDLHYIHNQNFFLDCAIIFRTITAVIRGVGAV
jgi:lipopolysaccharide/colanic/teichoic acid biosynthesis glycosyltransferase